MSVEVRPFRRDDREQVTALVNAHIQAVVPGVSVSVNAVMSQLEREPGEFVVDPWVSERTTLVAEQRGRIVAAAHLLHYAAAGHVGESYRDAGEIRWFVYWPEAPYWPDSVEAAHALIAACVQTFKRWDVARQYADGALPAPGVYGVPEQWPHVRATYARGGVVFDGHTEIVYIALVDQLPRPAEPAVDGVTVQRSLGINGTRLSALRDGEMLGYIEVETRLRCRPRATIGPACTRPTTMPDPTLYVFDGYNLMRAAHVESREELVDRLAGFVALRGARGVVVFDGVGEERRLGPLEVRFAEHADDLVERIAAERRGEERVAVVSSDAAIRETAGPWVERLSSRTFARQLAGERPPPPSAADRSRVEDALDPETRAKLERWRRQR
jgi:predicted RNA-binding protein with PIN domain